MSAIDKLRRQEIQEKRRSVALLLKQPRVSQLRELFERNSRNRSDETIRPIKQKEHSFAADPDIVDHVDDSCVEGVEGALAALEGNSTPVVVEIGNRQRTDSTLSDASNSSDSSDVSLDAEVADLSEPELDGRPSSRNHDVPK
jgi:hypothetical protein